MHNSDNKQRLQPPCRFVDTTDYRNGWELKTLEDVRNFFRKNAYLLEPERWGNLYNYRLTDANDQNLIAVCGSRGGLQMELDRA